MWCYNFKWVFLLLYFSITSALVRISICLRSGLWEFAVQSSWWRASFHNIELNWIAQKHNFELNSTTAQLYNSDLACMHTHTTVRISDTFFFFLPKWHVVWGGIFHECYTLNNRILHSVCVFHLPSRAMPEDSYTVRVSVDGVPVTENNTCKGHVSSRACIFSVGGIFSLTYI